MNPRRTTDRLRAGVGRVLERGAGRLLDSETPALGSTWLDRAAEAGWQVTPADRQLLRTIDRLLADREGPRVAVVTDRAGERLGRLLAAEQVHTLDTPVDELHASLARLARYDLVVLDTADPALRRSMVLRLFPFTKVGGHLVVARLAAGISEPGQRLGGYLADLADGVASDRTRGLRAKHLAALTKAIERVELTGTHAVLTNRTPAFAKLNEKQVNLVLDQAEGRRGRVLASRPGGTFEPRAALRENESPLAGLWMKRYDVPDLFLREYTDVRCTPGQVAAQGATLLPDTFRHIGRPRPGNRYAPDVVPFFATLKPRAAPTRVLTEPHFYWDSEFRGHFGHAMTEQLSRLWAFAEAKERFPDLKILMAKNKNRELTGFEVAILEAFGATREDITFVHEPVRVERLVAATPMFSQPNFVHPGIKEVWDRLGAHLDAQAPERDYPERFFVARRIEKRPCRNAAEVEALFASYGFEIVYPEDYPLAEQARMFRRAEVIGGYAGSGLFNAMLSGGPKHLVMVCSESYTAENEWMIAAVMGHRVDVAWCEAEIKMRKGGPHDVEAFHSPYTFDFDREGVFVKGVLDELGRLPR